MADPAPSPSRIALPPVCSFSGVSIPECSCPRCLEDQVRRFRPALLDRRVIGSVERRDRPLAA
jgi:hypothetical protein